MLDNTTIHLGDGTEVGSFNQEGLVPPEEIIVAVAPGIYYSYTNPKLIPDNEYLEQLKKEIEREDVYGQARIKGELECLMSEKHISAEGQNSLELIKEAFNHLRACRDGPD